MPAVADKPSQKTRTKKVPASALCFNSAVEFGEAIQTEGKTETPITLFARAAKPIMHPYWGKIEHDMAGLALRKETFPIDWCHWAMYGSGNDIIGVADEVSANNKGLTIKGKLISVMAEDRADVVMRQGQAGIPFEASIDFNGPMKLEELGEGMSAEVNGHKFTGPGVIVREWTLRSVAVCPYGADPNTKSKFSLAADAPQEIEVTLFSEGDSMAVDSKPADTQAPSDLKPHDSSLKSPDPPATDPAAAFKATLGKFVAEFGAENGSKWAAEGLSYEAALKQHADALAAQLKSSGEAKDKKIEELEAKLAAIPRGEETPASFNDAGKPSPPSGGDVKSLACKLGENIGKVAAAIKLPGKA